MAKIAVIEVTGAFANGKPHGFRTTLPIDSPSLSAWRAAEKAKLVKITEREVKEVRPLTIDHQVERHAQDFAAAVGGFARQTAHLSEDARRGLWTRVRALAPVQEAVRAALGLSIAQGDEEQVVTASAPAADAAAPSVFSDAELTELRELLQLGADATADTILDAIDELVGSKTMVDAAATAVLASEQDEPEAPAFDVQLLAHALASPADFTAQGLTGIAERLGLEVPKGATKAELYDLLQGAANPTPAPAAEAAPATDATPPAAAPSFLDDLDQG